jgi:hypothetical protein
LLDQYPGSLGKGTYFPERQGLAAAKAAVGRFASWRGVVLLGRRVGDAFGLRSQLLFQWTPLGDGRAAIMPHPSGLNRW